MPSLLRQREPQPAFIRRQLAFAQHLNLLSPSSASSLSASLSALGRQPTTRRQRRTLGLLALFLLACFFLLPGLGSSRSSSSGGYYGAPASTDALDGPHPIDRLLAAGQRAWHTTVKGQSKTADKAVKEYRRRYGIDPPPFFKDWFAFARENDHVLVDEYDGLTRSLLAFHAVPPSVLRARVDALSRSPAFGQLSTVVLLKNGSATLTPPAEAALSTDDKERERAAERGRAWKDLLETLQGLPGVGASAKAGLPFVVNEAGVPRAVVSWEDRREIERVCKAKRPPQTSSLYTEPSTPAPAWPWEAYVASCPPSSSARQLSSAPPRDRPSCAAPPVGQDAFELALRARDPIEALPLVDVGPGNGARLLPRGPSFSFLATDAAASDASAADDPFGFCADPSKRFAHAHFFSPVVPLSGLLPLFSPAAMPGYADVAIPSVEHTADPKSLRLAMGKRVRELADGAFELVGGGSVRKVVEPLPGEGEVAEGSWDARRNEVYWRGGATDGGATPGGYSLGFQRARLVRRFGPSLLDATPEAVVLPINPALSSSPLEAFSLPRSTLAQRAFNVGFSSRAKCEDAVCCEALEDGRFGLAVGKRDPWAAVGQFKMVVDVDGAGFSARFLGLFHSEAAVVKASLYREYASDWLQPWVHYIPLSLDFSELPSIWAYFLGASLRTPAPAPDASRQERLRARRLADSVGDRRLWEIAQAGSAWRAEVDRPDVDWAIYAYRLILEWRRIYERSDADFYAGRRPSYADTDADAAGR